MKLDPSHAKLNHKITFKIREGKIQAPEAGLTEDIHSQRQAETSVLLYEKLMRLNTEITSRVKVAAALDQTNDSEPDTGVVKIKEGNPLKVAGNLRFDPARLTPEPTPDDGVAVLGGVESGQLTVPDGDRQYHYQVLNIKEESKRGSFRSPSTTVYELHDESREPRSLGVGGMGMYMPPLKFRERVNYVTDRVVVNHGKGTITYLTDDLSKKQSFAPGPAVFEDNLPPSVASGPPIQRLQVALNTLESDILSGSKLSIEHPYGGDENRITLLERIRGLSNSTSAVSESWQKNRDTAKGELSIEQLAQVFRDESIDLDQESDQVRHTFEASERQRGQELKRESRSEYWRGVGKTARTVLIQGGMTLAGAAIGTMAGPPGMIFGALALGTLSVPLSLPSDFGHINFDFDPEPLVERPFDESRVEGIAKQSGQFKDLAEDASRWAEVLIATDL